MYTCASVHVYMYDRSCIHVVHIYTYILYIFTDWHMAHVCFALSKHWHTNLPSLPGGAIWQYRDSVLSRCGRYDAREGSVQGIVVVQVL